MAASNDSADSVSIRLSAEGSSSDKPPFPVRRITLSRENSSVAIGRASKAQAKGFVAAEDNLYFDSPVMSRQHAEIIANFDDQKVKIRDRGSLHGTFVNDGLDPIVPNETCEIKDGDRLKFGVPVWRGSENFSPTVVKLGVAFGTVANTIRDTEPVTSTFQVPNSSDDDSSDLDDSSSDDEGSVKENQGPTCTTPKGSVGVIDLTQQDSFQRPSGARVSSGTYELIDLSSPPRSPIQADGDEDDAEGSVDVQPTETEKAADWSSPARELPDLGPSPPWVARSRSLELDETRRLYDSDLSDDDESLSSFDDEGEHLSDSGMDSTDSQSNMSDNETESSDGTHLDSELDLDVSESDVEEEWSYYPNIGSDNEDLDDLDDLDNMGDLISQDRESVWQEEDQQDLGSFFRPKPAASVAMAAATATALATNATMTSSGPVTSPVKNNAPTRIEVERLLNSYNPAMSLLSTMEPAPHFGTATPAEMIYNFPGPVPPRHASPSDAAMPKSDRAAPLETRPLQTGLETLAQKTGKHAFFAAREENKAHLTWESVRPPKSSSLHALCNEDQPLISKRCGVVGGQEIRILQNLITPVNPYMQPPNSSSSAHDLNEMSTRSQPAEPSTTDQTNVTVDTTAPPPAASSKSLGIFSKNTLDKSSEQQKDATDVLALPPPKQDDPPSQTSRRTHVNISDIVDFCQQGSDKGKSKNKRMVEDISQATKDDEQWAALENEVTAALNTATDIEHAFRLIADATNESITPTPSPDRPDPVEASSKAEEHVAAVATSDDIRPAKRMRVRRIAERLGYAALGGVTAGAMIFGSLVYTAPTFG